MSETTDTGQEEYELRERNRNREDDDDNDRDETSFDEPGEDDESQRTTSTPVRTDESFPIISGFEPNDTLEGIQNKKNERIAQFISRKLNLGSVSHDAGENSRELFSKLHFTRCQNSKYGDIIGLEFNGSRIFVTKKGEIVESENKTNKKLQQDLKEFKDLFQKAREEYEKTARATIEEEVGVSYVPPQMRESVIEGTIENLEEFIDERYEAIIEQLQEEDVALTDEELREFRGLLAVKADDVDKLDVIKNIEVKHWNDKSEAADGKMKILYKAIAEVAELKADQIRLRSNLKSESEVGQQSLRDEVEVNNLTRFERFKKWAKENLGTMSLVAISIAGIITTVVISARGAIKKGAHATSRFAKSVAKILAKLGPVFSALGSVISAILSMTVTGLNFVAKNIWLLAIALTYFLHNEYKSRKTPIIKER